MTFGVFQKLIVGTGLTGTDLGSNTIRIDATGGGTSDPADDTQVWMPLFDTDGSLVLDDDGGVIPTLIPIA